MALGTTLTSFDALLKEHYPSWKIANLALKDRPLFAMMSKYELAGGRELVSPILFGDTASISASFSQAQNASKNVTTSQAAFKVPNKPFYGLTRISGQVIEATENDADAWLPAVKTQLDSLINSVSNALAVYMYGDGSGVLAQMANTTVSTSVITLANPDDVVKFSVGDELDLAAAVSTGNVRSYGSNAHGLYIGKIDRQAGTLTVVTTPQGTTAVNINDSADGLVTPGTTDYIFRRGDRNAVMHGLQAWLPSTVSSSDSFFGVNRSVDTRLHGQFLDRSTSGNSIEENLIDLDAVITREGGKLSHFFMHPSVYGSLAKSLGSKVEYVDMNDSEVGISFRGIVVNGQKGVIKVVADPFCPSNQVFGLDLEDDAWQLVSTNAAVHVLSHGDGLELLRVTDDDGAECRMGSYSEIVCRMPGYNGIIKLS